MEGKKKKGRGIVREMDRAEWKDDTGQGQVADKINATLNFGILLPLRNRGVRQDYRGLLQYSRGINHYLEAVKIASQAVEQLEAASTGLRVSFILSSTCRVVAVWRNAAAEVLSRRLPWVGQ